MSMAAVKVIASFFIRPSSLDQSSLALPYHLQRIHNISNLPETGSNASDHRWRGPQRLMDSHEITVHREQRDGMRVIFDLL